jgi:hypothetical protein
VPSVGFLETVARNLETFEPVELREQVTDSWAREQEARTQEDCRSLLSDQLPFHFRDPLDPRIDAMQALLEEMVFSPDVLRAAATAGYGEIDVQFRLAASPTRCSCSPAAMTGRARWRPPRRSRRARRTPNSSCSRTAAT